jgi:hypothetical protein
VIYVVQRSIRSEVLRDADELRRREKVDPVHEAQLRAMEEFARRTVTSSEKKIEQLLDAGPLHLPPAPGDLYFSDMQLMSPAF